MKAEVNDFEHLSFFLISKKFYIYLIIIELGRANQVKPHKMRLGINIIKNTAELKPKAKRKTGVC